MAIIAGIDEAGFGPILGPLVVSAVAFRAPDALAEADLWRQLSPAVTQKPSKRHAGLAIADSKRLYTPAGGLGPLERGVLGAFSLASRPPMTGLRTLLGWLCPAVVAEMAEYPWYRDADVLLPTVADLTDLRLRANALQTVMAKANIELTDIRSQVLLVGRYNRLVAASNNKAATLIDQTCALIDWVWRLPGGDGTVRVLVDRQGGREHYLPMLQRMYAGGQFKILIETPAHSGYRIKLDGRTLEAHFQQKGESLHLPVALASMASKYIRELFMSLENRYWAGLPGGAGLRPTAGYYEDGKRFLADIQGQCERLAIPPEILVRSR